MTTSIGRVGIAALGALATHLVASSSEGVHVCVGADRVLRLERAARCPAGATEFHLAEVEPKLDEAPGQQQNEEAVADLQARVAALSKQLAATERDRDARSDELARRISTLETAPGKTPSKGDRPASRVVAPFVVVDQAGKTILKVDAEPRSMVLSNSRGEPEVFISALETGGFFKARSPNASRETVLGVVDQLGALVIRQAGDQPRVEIGLSTDAKPFIKLRNDNGVAMSELTQGTSGGGYLQLGNAEGRTTVDAGTTPEGVGLIRAWPLGNPGAGLVGMPGTFLLGRR